MTKEVDDFYNENIKTHFFLKKGKMHKIKRPKLLMDWC